MSEESSFSIQLEQLEGFSFKVSFDWPLAPELVTDEPEPLGGAGGPNAARLLAAAAANCLSASLLYCVQKGQPGMGQLSARAQCELGRNAQGRLRILQMRVSICVADELLDSRRVGRCLDLFEDFCVVTQSIREGIPVSVEVLDDHGQTLHRSG